MLSAFLNPLLLLFSLATVTGLFLHDTRVDKAATVALAAVSPVGSETGIKPMLAIDFHTHIERSGVAHTMNILHSSAPGMQPRAHEDKRHLLQRNVPKGHHPFDNYYLPIV